MRKILIPPTCHPDRPRYAIDLCSSCYGKHRRQRASSREGIKIVDKRKYYKARYGISLETAELLYNTTKICSMCGGPPETRDGKFHIDHDHKTKKIRGMLCFVCNTSLGILEKRLHLIPRMMTYLGVSCELSLTSDQRERYL